MTQRAAILVQDDAEQASGPIRSHLSGEDYRVLAATDEADCLRQAEDASPDLVILRLRAPAELDRLRRLRERAPDVPALVLIPACALDVAVEVARLGAHYLVGEPDPREVSLAAALALEVGWLRGEVRRLRAREGAFLLPASGVSLEEVEHSLLRQAMERTGGNQSAAARLLGISRYALRYRLEKLGMLGADSPDASSA